jgi:glycosyltransferase involved in cell wall biosynthesis
VRQSPDHPGDDSPGGAAPTPGGRVLVVYLTDLTDHGRVLRQIEILASRYEVVVAATGGRESVPGVEFVELRRASPTGLRGKLEATGRVALRLAGRYNAAYWLDTRARAWRRALARTLPVDAIVLNDLAALPLARAVGGSDMPVVFDAHEHWTSESASWTTRQRISMRSAHDWIVDHHAARAAGIMTVSEGIARGYHERTGVMPALVSNAPFFRPLEPSPVAEPIRLLHVGIADPRRRLEDTIDAVRALDDRFVLDLVLRGGPGDYHRRLAALADGDPRIRLLPPVANDQLIAFANDYDIGVFLLPARYPNQVHVLPNKFFDYIQARLAVAIGPSPEMAALVRRWDCGVIADSFASASLTAALEQLTVAEVERMKGNADRAAQVLTADSNKTTLLSLVEGAVARAPVRS